MAQKEAAFTELVIGRLTTSYIHFHYRCGVVHDDMHTGNALLTDSGGYVKVIDWELAKVSMTDHSLLQSCRPNLESPYALNIDLLLT